MQKLEQRARDMIRLIQYINHENETLRADQIRLRQEFKALRNKNKIARSRVEQIISQLSVPEIGAVT